MVSNFLPHLLQLSNFVDAIQQLTENMLLQLHAFYNISTQQEFTNCKQFPLARIWRTLGDLISTFIGKFLFNFYKN